METKLTTIQIVTLINRTVIAILSTIFLIIILKIVYVPSSLNTIATVEEVNILKTDNERVTNLMKETKIDFNKYEEDKDYYAN